MRRWGWNVPPVAGRPQLEDQQRPSGRMGASGEAGGADADLLLLDPGAGDRPRDPTLDHGRALDPSPHPGTVRDVLGRSVRYVVGLDMSLTNVGVERSRNCVFSHPGRPTQVNPTYAK